jgi:hypothetical protein
MDNSELGFIVLVTFNGDRERRAFSTWENAERFVASLTPKQSGGIVSSWRMDLDDFCHHENIVEEYCCGECSEMGGSPHKCADCGRYW